MKRLIAILLLIPCFAGCESVLHELKPHRLSRLNYTDAPGRSDGSFLSVDDPLDVPLAVSTPEETMEPSDAANISTADATTEE